MDEWGKRKNGQAYKKKPTNTNIGSTNESSNHTSKKKKNLDTKINPEEYINVRNVPIDVTCNNCGSNSYEFDAQSQYDDSLYNDTGIAGEIICPCGNHAPDNDKIDNAFQKVFDSEKYNKVMNKARKHIRDNNLKPDDDGFNLTFEELNK